MCRLSLGEVCMCVTICVRKRAVYICCCIFCLFLPGVVLCNNQSEWTRREGAGFPGEVPAGSGINPVFAGGVWARGSSPNAQNYSVF